MKDIVQESQRQARIAATRRYTLRQVPHEGEMLWAIFDAAEHMLDPDAVARLALTPTTGTTRRFKATIADEGTPATPDTPPLRLRGFALPDKLMLTFLDTGYDVGVVRDLRLAEPGTIPGTTGWALVGEGRLHNTMLGDITWGAIQTGQFSGLCVVVNDEHLEDGVSVGGTFDRIIIGDRASSCLPGARILESSEHAPTLADWA